MPRNRQETGPSTGSGIASPETAPEKVKRLEATYRDLELVFGSIAMEATDLFDAAVWSAERKQTEASDALVRTGIQEGITQEGKKPLAESVAAVNEAREEKTRFDEHRTPNYFRDIPEDSALGTKLRQLGVRFDSGANSVGESVVMGAINARMDEVQHELREAKLEVVGGKEEMVVEVLRSGGYFANTEENRARMKELQDRVFFFSQTTPTQILNTIGDVDLSYPLPVRQCVVRALILRASKDEQMATDRTESIISRVCAEMVR